MERETPCDYCGRRMATENCEVCGANVCSQHKRERGCEVCNGGETTFS